MPMAAVVELVNDWGTVPRAARGDAGAPYPAASDTPARVRVADRLHPVFAEPDPAGRTRLVAALLRDARVRPTLSLDHGVPLAGWEADRGGDPLLAATAVALRAQLADHGAARLGRCTGHDCADVYVDTSPGGRRRFCSVTCQNRARVAAFRRRHAAG